MHRLRVSQTTIQRVVRELGLPREYRDAVLPPWVTARLSVEQASVLGWEHYVGSAGRSIGMHTFGASAPVKELQRRFGFVSDHVVAAARELARRWGLDRTGEVDDDARVPREPSRETP